MKRHHLLILSTVCFLAASAGAQTPSPPLSIVLPPRLLANAPATLAILGADGHLAPGVVVDIGNGQHATTDATGRASFTAPPDGAFIAKAQGVSVAALVDAAPLQAAPAPSVAPDVSQHDRFAICGFSLGEGVTVDHVTINGDAAFVLAASPVCVVILPQARTLAGPAAVQVEVGKESRPFHTALVALDFVPPSPPLQPGRKGKLLVRAEGTTDALRIVVENHSPDVIRFTRDEAQELRTSGGAQNQASIDVQAIRSGDFSLRARILPPPDLLSAARYLQIARSIVPKSPKNRQRELNAIAAQLARHPRDAAKARAAIQRLAASTPPGVLRTLLDAAAGSL
ncbi:MAG TPA: hypothetical protein VJS43_07085 [Candidatus Acidoferrales bacterium]|nr:hypothetical protein [Candidatus Acidoferrales bacterium]